MDGFCKKPPHHHGIDQTNIRMPKEAWRIVVLFRWLQSFIKKQAEEHRDKCKNDDKNENMWKDCKCNKIKLH